MRGLDETLLTLATVKADLGLYGEARQLLQEARALQPFPDGSGPPTERMAEILGNLGAVDLAQGDFASAQQSLEQSLAMRRRLNTDVTDDAFACRFHLATCLSFKRDHAGALRLIDEVQAYLRACLGKDDSIPPQLYEQVGTLLMDMGRFDDAALYLDEALRRLLLVCGEHHPDTASALQSNGQLRQLQGLYTEARPFLDRALSVWRTTEGHEHEKAITINFLGQLHDALGHHEEALRRHHEALVLRRSALGPDHWQVAESLNNVAGSLQALGRLGEATAAYQQCLNLPEKTLIAAPHLLASVHAGLGTVLSRQGRHHEALPHDLRSLQLRRSGRGISDLDLGLAEQNVGIALLYLDRASEAAPYLERAVALQKQIYGVAHRHTEDALLSLALAEAKAGHELRAFDLAAEASVVSSRRLGQTFGFSSEKQRDEHLSGVHTVLRCMIQLAVQIRDHAGVPVPTVEQAAFQQVLRLKGMRAEVLVLQMESISANHPELARQLQALAAVRDRMAQLALAASSGQALAGPSPQQALKQLATTRDEIEAHLAGQVPELAAQRRVQTCDLFAVSAALPPGSALVEYLRTPRLNLKAKLDRQAEFHRGDRYLAFVVPAAHPELACMINLGDAAHIDGLVLRCRDLFDRPPQQRPRDAPDQRAELRQAVFDPLLPALGGRTRLLVAPDVGLAMFPLEALPSAAGHVLLDDYQISYLACGRDLLRFQGTRPGRPGPPVVVAAPDFDLRGIAPATGSAQRPRSRRMDDLRGGHTFSPLPGTKTEGKVIAAALNVRPWLGNEALKEPLKRLRSPRLLHLATHGMHLPHPRQPKTGALEAISTASVSEEDLPYLENALYRSALALAGANSWLRHKPTPADAGNGLLTAEEVCCMSLLDTDLVVLSACETGIGDLQMGEGILGLRWAFSVAGARTLVASLWQVDDDATCALMIEFYRQLRAPQPVDSALRAAQQSLRPQWPDPYFWGAFVCQGDPALVPRLAN